MLSGGRSAGSLCAGWGIPTQGQDRCRWEGRAGRARLALTLYLYIDVVTITVLISYDPAKRQRTLDERGLDFEDASEVFSGLTFEVEDTRQDYGETRIICFGHLAGRLVVIGYVPRDAVRHVFSMRKANEREQARIAPLLGL